MPCKNREIRIVIADDHPIFRDALKVLLDKSERFSVVGADRVDGGNLQFAVGVDPDILILNASRPLMHRTEIIKAYAKSENRAKTIVLGDWTSRDEMAEFFECGAHGFVDKESAPNVLFDAIGAVMNGKFWAGNKAVSRSHQRRKKYKKSSDTVERGGYNLTPREMDVIRVVVSGYTNREISEKLAISEQTVKHHITNIFDKLGVYNRLELTLFVFHHGLVEN